MALPTTGQSTSAPWEDPLRLTRSAVVKPFSQGLRHTGDRVAVPALGAEADRRGTVPQRPENYVRHSTDDALEHWYNTLMTNLRSVVYVSTATRELTTTELEALLTHARTFNHQHHVTGVLLHSGPNFMQCFEGAPDDVREVYERVKRSSQHKDIVEYMDCELSERAFGSWAMGAATLAESEMLTLSTAEWSQSTQHAFSAKSPAGLEMLKVFWSMRHGAG